MILKFYAVKLLGFVTNLLEKLSYLHAVCDGIRRKIFQQFPHYGPQKQY